MAFGNAAKSGYTQDDLTRMGPDELEKRRRLAEALIAQSQGFQPIASPFQGMAQMAQALVGNLKLARLDRAEAAGRQGATDTFNEATMWPGAPAARDSGGSSVASLDAPDGPKGQESYATPDTNGYRSGIAGIESGGNYAALGPVTKTGDRAYGKYQMMGANIPQWTEQALGKRMTAQELLRDPAAQDKVFDHIFGGYVQKYGREGAAQAWFGGPGAIGQVGRKDQLGTTVGDYGKRFAAATGGADAAAAPAPTQVASLDPSIGMPPAQTGDLPAQVAAARAASATIPPTGRDAQTAGLTVGGQQPEVAPTVQPEVAPSQAPLPDAVPPQQMAQAQALIGGNDPRNSMTLGSPPVDPTPSMGSLMGMAGNQWMNPGQQRIIESLLGQQMKKQDPEYQMGLEKTRLELERLKHPQLTPYEQATLAEQQRTDTRAEGADARAAKSGALDDQMKQLQIDEARKGANAADFKVVGDRIIKIEKSGALSDVTPGGAPTPKLSDITAMRQDVLSDLSYKNLEQAVPIWSSVQDASTRDTAQADLNMIIGLAKLFDPTSVVRTQEGEAVKQTGDLPTEIYSQYAYLTGQPGARLSPEIRKGLLQEGWSRVKGYQDAYTQTGKVFTDMAKRHNIEPADIVPTFGEIKPYQDTPPPTTGDKEIDDLVKKYQSKK